MLVTSRSFAEYVAFFALDPDRLPRRVLDCSAGTSGFVAGARARGSDAVADGSFDLAVCSHLLFTWANVFDMAWHEAALREMARWRPRSGCFRWFTKVPASRWASSVRCGSD